MKLEIERNFLRIIPENKADEAFIEDTLNLKKDGRPIRLARKDLDKTHFKLPSTDYDFCLITE